MDQTVKTGICLTCGFLCRRDVANTHLPIYYEITREVRNKGRWFQFREEHLTPWCFRDVPIFPEIVELAGGSITLGEDDERPEERFAKRQRQNEVADAVVKRERACPLWMPYQPGLGPEAHLGGLARQEEEQRRVQFELDMEEGRRKFLEDLERQRQTFESRMETSRRVFTTELFNATDRFQSASFWLTVAAVLLAIAQVLTALDRGPIGV